MNYYNKTQLQDIVIFLRMLFKKIPSSSIASEFDLDDRKKSLFLSGIRVLTDENKLPMELVDEIILTLLKITPYEEESRKNFLNRPDLIPKNAAMEIISPRTVPYQKYSFEENFSLDPIRAIIESSRHDQSKISTYKKLLFLLFPNRSENDYSFLCNPVCQSMAFTAAHQAQSFCSAYIKHRKNTDIFNRYLKKLKRLQSLCEIHEKGILMAITHPDFSKIIKSMKTLSEEKPTHICAHHMKFCVAWTTEFEYFSVFSSDGLSPAFRSSMKKLAEADFPPAQYFLFEIEKNPEERIKHLNSSAKNDYIPALFTIGVLLAFPFIENQLGREFNIRHICHKNQISTLITLLKSNPSNKKECLVKARQYLEAAVDIGCMRAEYYLSMVLFALSSEELNLHEKTELSRLSKYYLGLGAYKNYMPAATRFAMMTSTTHTLDIFSYLQKNFVSPPKDKTFISYPVSSEYKKWCIKMLTLLRYELMRYSNRYDMLIYE